MSDEMSNTNGEKLWDEKNSIEPMKNNVLLQMNEECNTTTNINVLKDSEHLKGITKENFCGIYKIINKVNGKYYVGSSKNIIGYRGRWFWHKHFLRINKHSNKHLQHAWNKYGPNVWEWIIIETVEYTNLLITEQKYLNICKLFPDTNYNICYDANRPMLGVKHTFEVKQKIRDRMMGCKNPMYNVIPSLDVRLKISTKNKGKNKGVKHYNFGKSLTDEHKQKISLGGIGQTRTIETKQNISNALKNRIFTDEHKRKLSDSNKKYCGINHINYNHSTYNFINEKSNECFTGTRYEFMKKYNLPSGRCSKLINGKLVKLKNWIIQY